MQILSILFSGRKRLKTGKHKEIKSIRAGRMKKKLRIAFENFVKLKSRQQEMAALNLRRCNRVPNDFVWEKIFFFLAEIFSMNEVAIGRGQIKFVSGC